MRIITGRDYYDTAMAYGHDTSVVFVRSKNDTYPIKLLSQIGIYQPQYNLNIEFTVKGRARTLYRGSYDIAFVTDEHVEYCCNSIAVVLCGKLFNGFVFHSPQTRIIFWDRVSLASWLDTFDIKLHNMSRSWNNSSNIDDYFAVKTLLKEPLNWLIENKVTILTYDPPLGVSWSYNRSNVPYWRKNGDNLKELQFYKVMDPFATFQEIEMWQGGVLSSKGNPMVEIVDNDIRIAKHGFDKKSFRKDKQDKQSSRV